MNDVTRQYALALFSLAREAKSEKVVEAKLIELKDVLNEEFFSLMRHPLIRKEEKKQFLAKITEDLLLRHFLFVLVDNDRMDDLPDMITDYQNLITSANQLLRATVVSKSALTEEQRSRIQSKLEKDYARSVELEEQIDSSMLAGFKILFEGFVVDTSAEKKLADLKANLKK